METKEAIKTMIKEKLSHLSEKELRLILKAYKTAKSKKSKKRSAT